MATRGSCLCGSVKFEIDRFAGPFEICHCSRCRKVTGAGGAPGIRVMKSDFTWLQGSDFIQTFTAPLLHQPPAYTTAFCRQCGSPLPLLTDDWDDVEIPAGLLDGEPGLPVDKHIYVEFAPDWVSLDDGAPCYTREEIYKHRTGKDWPPDA